MHELFRKEVGKVVNTVLICVRSACFLTQSAWQCTPRANHGDLLSVVRFVCTASPEPWWRTSFVHEKSRKRVSQTRNTFFFKIRHFCRRIWNIDEFNIIFQEHVSFVNRDVFLVKNTEKTSAIERNLLKQDVFLVPCTLVSSLFEETRFFRWSVQGRGLGVRGFWCVYLEVLKSELLLFPVYPSAWLQWLNRLRFPVNKRPQTTLSQISERVFQLPLLISISGRETVSGRDSVSGFRRNFGFPVRVTEGPYGGSHLRDWCRQNASAPALAHGPPERNPTR